MSKKNFAGRPGVHSLGATSIRQLTRTIPAGTEVVDLTAIGVLAPGKVVQSLSFINPSTASGTLHVFLEDDGLAGGSTPVEAGGSWDVAYQDAEEFSVSGTVASQTYHVVVMMLDHRA